MMLVLRYLVKTLLLGLLTKLLGPLARRLIRVVWR
jgi:hypothetical protein